MMLAIERLKRIQSTSRRLSSLDKSTSGSETALEPPSSYPTPQWLIDQQGTGPQHFHHTQLASAGAARTPGLPSTVSGGNYHNPLGLRPPPGSPSPYGSAQEVAIYTKPKRSPSGENLCSKPSLELSTFSGSTEHLRGKTKLVYQPDVVAIQVNRNTPVRTGSTSEEASNSQQVIYESFKGPIAGSPKIHSSTDDSVFTFSDVHNRRPSVERTYSDDLDGLATIRRPSAKVSPRVAPKPKPVAKIVAKTKRTSRDFTMTTTADIIKIQNSDSIENYKYNATNSLDRKLPLKNNLVAKKYMTLLHGQATYINLCIYLRHKGAHLTLLTPPDIIPYRPSAREVVAVGVAPVVVALRERKHRLHPRNGLIQ